MEQVSNDDFDFILLRMKKKFTVKPEKKGRENGGEGQDFGMGFSLRVPEEFERADAKRASCLFWSEKRPPVILTTSKGREGLTFQFFNGEVEGESLLECSKMIKQLIEQLDGRCVFYSAGEESETVWFDYKSFAENECVYNLVFLFQTSTRKVLGTFFCLFEEYDKWKPQVLKLLKTIKTKEEVHEGL
ncbi:MAG: hypothetical protein HDR24_04890 [Lachnospiraceae bacterium]|nr:hypothetical protein [Lachnospiraceae bacterium]